jgi:hypothetical protein
MKGREMSDMAVARTILAQLGGNRFRAMTGARNFVGDDNSLRFRLPGTGGFCNNGINAVKITLNGMDLYDVVYMRIRGGKITTVEEVNDLYFDSLTDSFERVTGLRTSLGKVARG